MNKTYFIYGEKNINLFVIVRSLQEFSENGWKHLIVQFNEWKRIKDTLK